MRQLAKEAQHDSGHLVSLAVGLLLGLKTG